MKSGVIFGAGNVGRGFIGQLLCESGLRVTFVDIDEELVTTLARDGSYRLEAVFNDEVTVHRIAPVTALAATGAEAVIEAVAAADLGATAVGARALPHLVPLIAGGIARRAAQGAPPQNFIICENLKGAAATVRGLVRERLASPALPYFERSVGFVDTVIGRMVPIPTPEMRAADVSLIRVEPYKELPVDRAGFAGPVPQVVAMTAYDNFPRFTARKLYLHNCGHALLAYPGYLLGHAYGYEALADARIRRFLDRGLAESRDGIVHALGADPAWLDAHIADLLLRFGNRALGDTVFRLGRDPVRKLQPDDRLVGAARLAEKAGRSPRCLAVGIAAALRFAPTQDPVAVDLQNRVQAHGLPRVLAEVTGIAPTEPLGERVLQACSELRQDPVEALARVTLSGE